LDSVTADSDSNSYVLTFLPAFYFIKVCELITPVRQCLPISL